MVRVYSVFQQKRKNAEYFQQVFGYELDYSNPQTFNEKLNWLKFNYRHPLMTKCSSKYGVREYAKGILGDRADKYLTKLVGNGIYRDVSDIDFSKLPSAFALKLNNGSGKNIICSDKENLNIKETISTLESWMKPGANHYYNYFEWGYKNIKPSILCEEFLGDMGTVRDYKFFCFNGVPEFIYVSEEKDTSKQRIDMDYMTLDWKRASYERKSYKPPEETFTKPSFLSEMTEIAKELSANIPFVRVDFFDVNNKPKLAEMTFYPAAGYGAFERIEHDYEIGELLDLPFKHKPARLFDLALPGIYKYETL